MIVVKVTEGPHDQPNKTFYGILMRQHDMPHHFWVRDKENKEHAVDLSHFVICWSPSAVDLLLTPAKVKI